MTFDDFIAGDVFSHIHGIEYAVAERSIVIKFLKDPEGNQIDRILIFSTVEDFSIEEFEDEDVLAGVPVIEALIGLEKYHAANGMRYVVHTTLREMIFISSEEPKLHSI